MNPPSCEALLAGSIALAAASGVPGLFIPRRSRAGPRIAGILSLVAAAVGGAAAIIALGRGEGSGLRIGWALPGAELVLRIDALGAIFLLPVFLISAVTTLYGLTYWSPETHPENHRKLRSYSGTLTAGMTLLIASRNGVAFLFGWEIMALSAFFLIATDDRRREVREASWIYLAATHLGTLTLFALFGVWQATTGGLDIGPIASGSIAPGRANTIFILALIGFGLKAGLYPLQFWLPSAHAQAPSHVSAMLSGVLIKMGVYGVVRFVSLLPDPPLWWGVTLLALGGASGVLGVAFALGQHDLKRLLAYHSIENIGIIFIGIGLALLGRSTGRAEWVVLGLGGALLHVWNHGLFKSLLFLAAGSAIHAAHTREIDHLGGLARRMPMTAFAFLIGSVAICGLPPLNGFVSELWIFLGLFRAGITPGWESAAPIVLIPVLALIGGLALICFVKVFGVVFLGEPRHEHTAAATESPRGMLWPMAPLAGACLWIGVFPATIAPWLDAASRSWLSGGSGAAGAGAELPGGIASLVPLSALTATALLLLLGLAAGWSRLRSSAAGRGLRSGGEGDRTVTWDCGYAYPSARMQYTASSFAEGIVGQLRVLLLPRVAATRVTGNFPGPGAYRSEVADIVLDRALLPLFRSFAWLFSWFRLLQRGRLHAYLFYIFLTLLVLLLIQ